MVKSRKRTEEILSIGNIVLRKLNEILNSSSWISLKTKWKSKTNGNLGYIKATKVRSWTAPIPTLKNVENLSGLNKESELCCLDPMD